MSSLNSAAPDTAAVTVEPVDGKKALETFIRLPWRLYADDPNWVPPLLREVWDQLSRDRNPYFEHAEAQYWIAYRNGRPVGRISAQVDQLVLKHHGTKTGHFGFLEAEDDPAIFSALFAAALNWLRDQGMEQVIGPFNLSINQESGLLVDGFDSPPMMLMGHAPRHYGNHVEALGFEKVKDLYAYAFDIKKGMPPLVHRLIERAEAKGKIQLRQLDMKRYAEDLTDILDIFNDAWSENWGFLPLTGAEAKKDVEAMKLIIQEDLVYIAEVDGKPVGMMVTLPNLNEAIADLNGKLFPFGWAKLLWRLKVKCPKTSRVVMMGVRKEYQGGALGAAIAFMLVEQSRKNAERKGMEWGELSWVLDDNVPMQKISEAIKAPIYKTYRLYTKSLVRA
ncbi:MAG: N-acetyltransferase [Sphingomonadales bacterium]